MPMTDPIKRQLAQHEIEHLTDDELKSVIKIAIKEAVLEWMDEQYKRFGKWSFYALAATAIGALTYMILMLLGFKRG